MRHALVIGRDLDAAEQIANCLWNAGYHSLIHVLDACEAWATLTAIKPSLIVLASEAGQVISSDDLYRMSDMARTPVLVARGAPARALACLGDGVSPSGSYPIRGIRQARAKPSSQGPGMAHAA
jgi:AmiR/NasT family two-component response regulator